MILNIKKFHNRAVIPRYELPGDAGCDLFVLNDITIHSDEIVRINTGIAVEIPHGYVGLVFDKSGIAFKYGLTVLGGVIDSGYRGEIIVIVKNLTGQDVHLSSGDKIAQLLIQKIERPEIRVVNELSDTERGVSGFGSTGR